MTSPRCTKATTPDVAIVGGGIAGLGCAVYLARLGATVAVFESNRVGSGASDGNAGWVCPAQAGPLAQPGLTAMGFRALFDQTSALYFAPSTLPSLVPWLRRFQRFCNEESYRAGYRALSSLGARSFQALDALVENGLRVELHKLGLLAVATTPTLARKFLADLQPIRDARLSVPDEVIGQTQLRELEPGLAESAAAGVKIDEHWHVRAESLIGGLAHYLRNLGVELLEGAQVHQFLVHGDRINAIRTAAGDCFPQTVIMAAGAWTPILSKQLGYAVPLAAGKGYSFTIDPVDPMNHAVCLLDPHIACSPLADGTVRVAGTMEFSGLNSRLDYGRLEATVRGARRMLGPWRTAPRNPWVGPRPILPDGLPVIDRVPGIENAYLATGYSMLGMTLGLPAGEALAEFVLTGNRPVVLEPFSAVRFGVRSRPRRESTRSVAKRSRGHRNW